jgi:GWxTD domain-containing protein
MFMRRIGTCVGLTGLWLALGASAVFGQPLTVRGGMVVFDRPEFDTLALVEFPFTLNRAEFQFFRPDSTSTTLSARIFAQITLLDTLGTAIDSANTYFSSTAPDSLEARRADFSLFNRLVLAVRPGTYAGRLSVIDVVSKREGAFNYERIAVTAPERNRLAIGGVSLAYRAEYQGPEAKAESGVDRNGFRVLCNPDGLFSANDTAIFVYAEVYNLDYHQESPGRFTQNLSVLHDSGSMFRALGSRTRPKPGRSAVAVESFDIGGWPPGLYALEIKFVDSSAAQEVAREVPFAIVDPRITAATAVSAEPGILGDLDLATQLNLVRFLLTPEEQAALDRLNDTGKLSYLAQYWRDRDPNTTTPVNERFQEIYERYLYANNFFSFEEGKTDGWKTDRGRVLLVYGRWDRLEDQIHPTADYPYQVWWYEQTRQKAVFVFVDDRGTGNFRLVHSTMPGEFFSDDWDEAIRAGFLELE